MSFLAPSLLFGLLLAAAPIIIHLLNRRRFVRVDWAPMKYLKLTLKTNRRRVRLEQWLLLAVRTLAVLVLFLAAARPVGQGASLAEFLAVHGRASRIFVIDDSLSMGAQSAGVSAFDRAREIGGRLLIEVGPQDSVTVLVTSRPDEALVRHAQLENATGIAAQIKSLDQSDAASQWPATFDAVDGYLRTSVFPLREVILITDLASAGWTTEVETQANRWADERVTLRIVDVGVESAGNHVLESLVQDAAIALVDTEVRFTARVRNDSADPLDSEQALLSVDKHTQPLTLPEIPAVRTVEFPVTLVFDSPGQHRVSLTIPGDPLPGDNVRHLAVDVRSAVEVTLVDGEPGVQPFESETDFLAAALTAGNAPWRMHSAVPSEWMGRPVGAPDAVVLANVESISPDRIRELEEMVTAGMGLMIFPGDQIDPEAWNSGLYRDGRGLLPGRVDSPRDQEASGLVIEPLADSPVGPLAKIAPEALAGIRPRRFLDVSLPEEAGEQVRVLARWNDPLQSPALIEKRIGQGQVLFWTITADRAWSDWPTQPTYVLAMRLAAQSMAGRISHWENVTVGQPLRFPLDPEFVPATSALQLPDGGPAAALRIVRPEAGPPELLFPRTRKAGHYEARWDEPGRGEQSRIFAANPDIRDSRLDRLTDEELAHFLGRLQPKRMRYSGGETDLASAGSELWRSFILALVALVLLESALAAWVGRVR